MVKFFITYNAKVNAKIHLVEQLLLAKGPKVNARDNDLFFQYKFMKEKIFSNLLNYEKGTDIFLNSYKYYSSKQ